MEGGDGVRIRCAYVLFLLLVPIDESGVSLSSLLHHYLNHIHPPIGFSSALLSLLPLNLKGPPATPQLGTSSDPGKHPPTLIASETVWPLCVCVCVCVCMYVCCCVAVLTRLVEMSRIRRMCRLLVDCSGSSSSLSLTKNGYQHLLARKDGE